MLSKEIKRILDKHDDFIQMFDYYDRTGVFPLDKVRRSFTIRQSTFAKLKKAAVKNRQSMSDTIDRIVDENL